ncbi:aldehyde dehydrogenase family protein [Streptomyces xanthophaeus]|nr:aldehyde dehydrogenase family protein [Streptomyces xanthophaeus]
MTTSNRATLCRSCLIVPNPEYGAGWNPAHAAFGGYKQSGIGRETHKMMLEHYQQTKNMLVSYSPKRLGFF